MDMRGGLRSHVTSGNHDKEKVSNLKSPRKGGLNMDEHETNESMLQIVNILDS